MNRFVFIHIKQTGAFITETRVFPKFFRSSAEKQLQEVRKAVKDHGDGNLYYTSETIEEDGIAITIRETKHTLLIKKL